MDYGQIFATVVPITGLIAAIIAGLVSWIGHRVSRKNALLTAEISRLNAQLNASLESTVKLAEFRQNWINEMRADMAAFQSKCVFLKTRPEIVDQVFEIENRILLRMNPRDVNHDNLSMTMYRIRTANTPKELGSETNKFVQVCQLILKDEWDVLKRELRTLNRNSDAD